MNIEHLSNEVIEGICEKMDLQTLSRYMTTNVRNKEICSRILEKKKKEDIQTLIQNYPFTDEIVGVSAEDKQMIYEEIVKHAEPNNELYKIKFYHYDNPLSAIDGTSICNVYFKGNLYRAILSAQKYLYDAISKFNMLNYILDKEFFESVEENGDLDIINSREDRYDEFIEMVVNLLISGGIQYSNPGLEEADIEYPKVL